MAKKQLAPSAISTDAALAEALGASLRTVKGWKTQPGFPLRSGGSYDIEAVKAWLDGRTTKTATAKEGIERERAARIAKLEAQTAILLRQYIPKGEVDQTMASVAIALKRELDRARLELSTRLIGMTAAQANAELDKSHKRILNTLSDEKWTA